MSNKQPEALRLANEFNLCVEYDSIPSINDIEKATTELRRLHTQCDELLDALESIVNYMFADFDDLPMANRVQQVIAKAKGQV